MIKSVSYVLAAYFDACQINYQGDQILAGYFLLMLKIIDHLCEHVQWS